MPSVNISQEIICLAAVFRIIRAVLKALSGLRESVNELFTAEIGSNMYILILIEPADWGAHNA